MAVLDGRIVPKPQSDRPKPWDMKVAVAAPKLVDENRVNLRSAARLAPKPVPVESEEPAPLSTIDRALAAANAGNVAWAQSPAQTAAIPARGRRGWGFVAAGMFLLSATALTYGVVRYSADEGALIPSLLAQFQDEPGAPASLAIETGERTEVAAVPLTPSEELPAPSGAEAGALPGGEEIAPGPAPEAEAAPQSTEGSVATVEDVGGVAPRSEGVVGFAEPAPAPRVVSSLDGVPATSVPGAAALEATLPGFGSAPGVSSRSDTLGATTAEALVSGIGEDVTASPAPYDLALAVPADSPVAEGGADPAGAGLEVTAPVGVLTEAPTASEMSLALAPTNAPGLTGADATSDARRAQSSAALSAPEVGPPGVEDVMAIPSGFASASLGLPNDQSAQFTALRAGPGETGTARALGLAMPTTPQGSGATPDLSLALVPPQARPEPVERAPAPAVQVVLNAPASVTEDGLSGAAASVAAATGFTTETRPLVDFSISSSNVRYFHAEDREAAAAVATELSARLRDFTGFTPAPEPGIIEVWLSGAGGGSQTAAATPTPSRPAAQTARPARAQTAAPAATPVFKTSTVTRTRTGAARLSGQ
ncbi:MAG: hypothetical protein AAGB18_00895 [Pseudomonadota bacterium]